MVFLWERQSGKAESKAIEKGPRSLPIYGFPRYNERENTQTHRVVADVRTPDDERNGGADLKITRHSRQPRRWKVSSLDFGIQNIIHVR